MIKFFTTKNPRRRRYKSGKEKEMKLKKAYEYRYRFLVLDDDHLDPYATDIVYACSREQADENIRTARKLKSLSSLSMFEYYIMRHNNDLKKKKMKETNSNLALISVEERSILLSSDHCVFRARV